MTPTNVILAQIPALLAADTTTLAAALALKVHLSQANFTPGPALIVGSFTEANFSGYAALSPTPGSQNVFIDPATGLRTVELKAPLGGWVFITTGVANLPQTIYGFYVTDNAGAVLYASQLLATPIPLTVSGQGIVLPDIRFSFLGTSPF
jgi:hypothetical protein